MIVARVTVRAKLLNRRFGDDAIDMLIVKLVLHWRRAECNGVEGAFCNRTHYWVPVDKLAGDHPAIPSEWSCRYEHKAGAGIVLEVRRPSISWRMMRFVEYDQVKQITRRASCKRRRRTRRRRDNHVMSSKQLPIFR